MGGQALAMLLAAALLGGYAQGTTIGVATGYPPSEAPPLPPEPRIVPIPPIPASLRGCWQLDDPDFPDEQDRLIVTATKLIVPRGEGQAEYIQSVSDTAIEGLFTMPDGDSMVPIATGLHLGNGEFGRTDQLILNEGDSGSWRYSRCSDRD